MTDVAMLVTLIERDPESEIVVAMLTDELMEARGMIRSEADRHVERVRADARNAIQMAFAAGLIKARGPAYYHLRNYVAQLLDFQGSEEYTLLVVTGDHAPVVAARNPEMPDGSIIPGLAVAVPAGWVVFWHRVTKWPIHADYSRKGN